MRHILPQKPAQRLPPLLRIHDQQLLTRHNHLNLLTVLLIPLSAQPRLPALILEILGQKSIQLVVLRQKSYHAVVSCDRREEFAVEPVTPCFGREDQLIEEGHDGAHLGLPPLFGSVADGEDDSGVGICCEELFVEDGAGRVCDCLKFIVNGASGEP